MDTIYISLYNQTKKVVSNEIKMGNDTTMNFIR